MPSPSIRQRILPRLQQWRLAGRLAREAGWRHLSGLALLSTTASVLDIAGLGIGVSLLLGAAPGSAPRLPLPLTLPQGVIALVGLMLVRGLLQALVSIGQERLRSGLTDTLRHQLLDQVLHASSTQLEQLGRGDLLGLLMADISRSVLALDQGVRTLQALLSLVLYAAGVLVVGREVAIPLLLALGATGAAAVLQRSGSWQLGRLQSQLNGALQRTVGDGLHGLKAVRAAAAESWLLQRFGQDNARFRRVLRQTVQRQALFAAWRDTLVVLVVGLWLLWGRAGLAPAAVATTLLLAYRSGTSLSAVISAQRLCLGALPGYDELCWIGFAACWGKTAAAGSWTRTRDRCSSPVQRVPLNCVSSSPTPPRGLCCLKPVCARIYCWISTRAPSRSKPGWSAWGWAIAANGAVAWTPPCPWRWITSPVARFTGWACCEPGCAIARWKCWMNPPPFWMRNRLSGSARSLRNAPRNGWCW
jgi:hypothetical protein